MVKGGGVGVWVALCKSKYTVGIKLQDPPLRIKIREILIAMKTSERFKQEAKNDRNYH